MFESIQEKIWYVEHQVRGFTSGRGMRPGRAIRRVFQDATDEEVQALAGLWSARESEFQVRLGLDVDLFVEGYDTPSIHSCMSGWGGNAGDAYTHHGVGIAVGYSDGEPVARSLVWAGIEGQGAFVKTYGPKAYAMEVFLRRVACLKAESLREAAFASQICLVRQEEVIVAQAKVPELRRVTTKYGTFLYTSQYRYAETYTGYEVVKPAQRINVVRRDVCVSWRPYVD